MKKLNSNGFTAVEGLIIFVILTLLGFIGPLTYGQITSKDKQIRDSVNSENLSKAQERLSKEVTENKTIPTSIATEGEVVYSRKDNQTAELCATFNLPRSGSNDNGTNPLEIFKAYFLTEDKRHNIYRDDVDFAKHSAGRNCYEISYAPINVAYEDKYKDDNKNWKVCDSYRQYHGKYTGQTIKGFTIGGPITTNPGAGDRRTVLAGDIDAYDESCTKIPISDLDVGDKVELFIETFDHTETQFVKAIIKTAN